MTRQLDPGSRPTADGRQDAVLRSQAGSRSGGAQQINVEFEAGPSAAHSARNALLALENRIDPDLLNDVRLLVSELVTNSVRHSESPMSGTVRMDVSLNPSTVRVEVADGGKGFEPRPRDPDNRERVGGWGLYLVDRMSDRWGVARSNLTRVWFEIDRPQVPSAAL